MKKVIISISLCLLAGFSSMAQDDLFVVTQVNGNSVTFKTTAATPVYNVSFVYGQHTVDATFISNISGEISMSNGATAREGSHLMMPHAGKWQSGEMLLPAGAVLTCAFNNIPDGSLPQKVMFQTSKNADPVYFNLQEDEVKSVQAPVTIPQMQPEPLVRQPQPEPVNDVKLEVPFVQQVKPVISEKRKKWYLETGLYAGVLLPEAASWSSSEYPVKTMVPVGAALDLGYYFHQKHRLSLDLSIGFHSLQIGTFEYTKTSSEVSKENFSDGVLNRQYTLSSLLMSYHYVLAPAKKINIRLGASFGANIMFAADRYQPVVDNTPDSENDSDRMAVAGAGLGLIWNIGKNCFVDSGYRAMIGNGLELDDFKLTAPVHQLNLTLGFRF